MAEVAAKRKALNTQFFKYRVVTNAIGMRAETRTFKPLYQLEVETHIRAWRREDERIQQMAPRVSISEASIVLPNLACSTLSAPTKTAENTRAIWDQQR